MAYKNPEDDKAQQKRYREQHKKESKLWQCKRRRQVRQLIHAVKLHYGCTNPSCKWDGEFTPEMLDFNHIDPRDKSGMVSQMGTAQAVCMEINKCCVLCANCHRQATWGQLDASQFQKCNVTPDGKLVGAC